MAHSSDKYSIAWFKLAECVGRRERERALSVYRLLVHSLQDDALAAQLEGDILAAFGESRSVDSYYRAARLYEQRNKVVQAVTAYEHAAVFANGHELYLTLVRLYDTLGNGQKMLEASQRLIASLLDQQRFSYVQDLIRELPLLAMHKALLYEQLILRLLQRDDSYDDYVLHKNIAYVIEHYQSHATDRLTTFLSALRGLNDDAAYYAYELLDNATQDGMDGTKQVDKHSPSAQV